MALGRKPPERYERSDVRRAHMIITAPWALVLPGRLPATAQVDPVGTA